MDSENQLPILLKEKENAVQQLEMNKNLVAKLESELQLMRDITAPPDDKNILLQMQKEYTEIIDILQNKVKDIQEKYQKTVNSNIDKDKRISNLTDENNNLKMEVIESKRELATCMRSIQDERIKYADLESQLIDVETTLHSNEHKYTLIKHLETERDDLQQNLKKMSNDCQELETALEMCHEKIGDYEKDIQNLLCQLNILNEEKNVILENDKAAKEEILRLENDLEHYKREFESRISEEMLLYKNQFDAQLNQIIENFCDKESQAVTDDLTDPVGKMKSSCITPLKLQNILERIVNENEELSYANQKLNEKLNLCLKNLNKYKEYVSDANQTIEQLETEIRTINVNHKQDQRKLFETLSVHLKNSQSELNKQIKSQENLHTKWKKDMSELIVRFQTRISELTRKYKKKQRQIKKLNGLIKQK